MVHIPTMLQSRSSIRPSRSSERKQSGIRTLHWPSGPSAPFTTAYVLWGLHHARQFGYAINEELFRQGIAHLEQHYIAPATAQVWQMNESAFTLLC